MYKEHRVHESCTVVESIATDGFSLTPLIIFRGENQIARWHKIKKEIDFWFGNASKEFNNSIILWCIFKKSLNWKLMLGKFKVDIYKISY